MKPPVSYFGGKTRIADWIVSLLPEHRVYVEGFLGSGAVFFAKRPAKHEILNDLDGDVVNFFRMLRERGPELERACRLTPYSRDEYNRAVEIMLSEPPEDPLERARLWWVMSTQAYGAVVKRGTGWSTSVVQNSNNARTVLNRLERFAPIIDRLQTATIENRDAIEIVRMYDAADAVIYLDPPYLDDVRTSFAGGRRPAGDYAHEFCTHDQHRELAKAAGEARATVFVSGYESELYDEIYAGWERAERRVLARSSQRRGGNVRHRLEVVWSNRPLATGRLFGHESA